MRSRLPACILIAALAACHATAVQQETFLPPPTGADASNNDPFVLEMASKAVAFVTFKLANRRFTQPR